MSTDVLIVGAGPVGLTLALECQRHGIAFRIVDKNPTASDKSKALAVWSGTIECLAAMGVIEDFQKKSQPIHQIVFSDSGKTINHACVHEEVESLYAEPFICPQSETEAILLDNLRNRGVNIERPVELVGLKNGTENVEATLRHVDGSLETVTAKWLIGCDGGRSFVRHQLPVEFQGVTESKGFILVDAKLEGEMPEHSVLINWGPACVCAFFPIRPGVFRMFAQRPDTTNHEPPTLEEMQASIDANGLKRLKLRDPEWLAYFGVNERYVNHMNVGRVFLAGDAAHIHSPAGGQGMNTGMQDAFNLGWKLALILRGKGDPESLVGSFHSERHPVAKTLVEKTTRLLHFGMANNAFLRLAKDIAITFLFQSRFVQKTLSGELSELHINYPESPLVISDHTSWPNRGGFEPGSKPRDVDLVCPLTGSTVSLWRKYLSTRHTLLLFSGKNPLPETSAKLPAIVDSIKPYLSDLQVLTVWTPEVPAIIPQNESTYLDPKGIAHERYGLDQPGWYLVRPDQYLAARSSTLQTDALHSYLKKALG